MKSVPDVLFYHLQKQPLESVLPQLLEKSLQRGWRCAVRFGSTERLALLDAVLWTYRDDGFLPHGPDTDPLPERQPILLTLGDLYPNGAQVLFLVDGAPMPADRSLERIVVMFDGGDDDQVKAARELWKSVTAGGTAATYWQQDDSGRWQKKAESGNTARR